MLNAMDAWVALSLISLLGAGAFLGLYLRERRIRKGLSAEFEKMSEQMSTRLVHDDLTGLLSRAGFEAVLDKAAHAVDTEGGTFCVMYLALDNFGFLNDAYGRASGDRLLQSVSQRLTRCTADQGEVCRINSGEFAFSISGDLTRGRVLANAVAQALSEPFSIDRVNTQVSCSIGIATYPDHGSRAKILANSAMAMRSVKLTGGGGFCEYDTQMGVEVIEQAQMVNDLRGALAAGQFELYFQPKVDAHSLQVTAAEALLRWHHPTRGLVSPVVFIPLAERYGLIGAIGNWVIEEACRKAGGWREKGLRMRIAVNISGYQMREDDLIERIESALQRHKLQASRFTCEITESVAMEDTKVTQTSFEKMRNAGFHVSIDDFGTGYSSLAMLRKLPAAELKIDRAFVIDLEESETARSIAKSIVNLARALHLRVVAEGVETDAQCQLLIELGCDELQGYLFSKPIRAHELEALALNVNGTASSGFRESLFQPTNDAQLD